MFNRNKRSRKIKKREMGWISGGVSGNKLRSSKKILPHRAPDTRAEREGLSRVLIHKIFDFDPRF